MTRKTKLWILRAVEPVDYDSYDAHVVRAETEEEARSCCPNGDESGFDGDRMKRNDFWTDAEKSTCVELTVDGDAGMVLSSFNAG